MTLIVTKATVIEEPDQSYTESLINHDLIVPKATVIEESDQSYTE